MKQTLIQVKNLRKEYPMGKETVRALAGVSLSIARGEICCIFGQSGSGKSTLLNMLAGLEKPTAGAVKIGPTIVSRLDEQQLALFRQKHTGFVFQSYNLLPALSALENVALPLQFQGVPKNVRQKKAAQMLARVGLKERLKHYPSQMSGGQQQRVGIARAFITQPDVVFADEPTGNLDSKSRREIMEMITAFARRYGQTIVLVTHDPEMAAYADHTVTLLDGKIVEESFKECSDDKEQKEGAGTEPGAAAAGESERTGAGRTGERTGTECAGSGD